MKVLNLRCGNGHGFEGWFASEDAFIDQNGQSQIECPLCADRTVVRLPSAPRLNLSSSRAEPAPPAVAPAEEKGAGQVPRQAPPVEWLARMRKLLAQTENVGTRFAEEARRIHYGESSARGIRGQASRDEREALQDEGIETVTIALPRGLDGPLQ